MATFPKPLCELRIFWTQHRPRPGDIRRTIQVAERVERLRAGAEGLHFGPMISGLRVRPGILSRLVEEARRQPLTECCGLLAGSGGVITEILPARNALASATVYEIAPDELFRLFRQIRERGLDYLGIYHSHPATDNSPSPADIERAYYPDAAYFIVTPQPGAARPVRAFWIRGGNVIEWKIEEVEG
ncbi:MAG TPA: M67 family metallopeptidase [Candidatus Dormibacteraeota bacterium]|nr:M67 family metallopeptidase [Candidatus Dormibacteraeota bacterium]